jgi:anti-anti-sigma factor
VTITIQSDSKHEVCIVAFDAQYHSDDRIAIDGARDALEDNAIISEHSRVVIDLTSTEYFGSALVGLLFALHLRIRALGGRLAACVSNENCKNVLSVTQFDRHCPVFTSRTAAVASVLD